MIHIHLLHIQHLRQLRLLQLLPVLQSVPSLGLSEFFLCCFSEASKLPYVCNSFVYCIKS